MSWIRERVAIEGAVLDNLKDPETGETRSGWRVVSAGGTNSEPRPESLLMKRSRDWKKTRDASDI